jgi:hypothetical protein
LRPRRSGHSIGSPGAITIASTLPPTDTKEQAMKKRKLRLEPDALRVEAFPTAESPKAKRGTVQGFQSSLGGDCPSESWSGPHNCFCCAPTYPETECCWTNPLEC